jgi:hypothetical protein
MTWWRSCAVLFLLPGPLRPSHALAADLPAATAAPVAPFGRLTAYKPAQAGPDGVRGESIGGGTTLAAIIYGEGASTTICPAGQSGRD